MGCPLAKRVLQSLPQCLLRFRHRRQIQVPCIALVNVKGFYRGQGVCALHLPGQSLELRIVSQCNAHRPPARRWGGWVGFGGFWVLQMQLHAQGGDDVAPGPYGDRRLVFFYAVQRDPRQACARSNDICLSAASATASPAHPSRTVVSSGPSRSQGRWLTLRSRRDGACGRFRNWRASSEVPAVARRVGTAPPQNHHAADHCRNGQAFGGGAPYLAGQSRLKCGTLLGCSQHTHPSNQSSQRQNRLLLMRIGCGRRSPMHWRKPMTPPCPGIQPTRFASVFSR